MNETIPMYVFRYFQIHALLSVYVYTYVTNCATNVHISLVTIYQSFILVYPE